MEISIYVPLVPLSEKNMPFYVASIGFTHETTTIRPSGIEDCQLLYTMEGKGEAVINGKPNELNPGSILYLPSDYPHEYRRKGPVWDTLYICFGGSGISSFKSMPPAVWPKLTHFDFEEWYNKLINLKHAPNKETELSITLYSMLLDFKDKTELFLSPASKERPLYISVIYEMADGKIPTLSEAAEKVGVSESYFCRVFKEYTGLRPLEYMNLLKIQRAKELLHNMDLSIKEISSAVGFESPSYFSLQFRRYTGITPTLYRGI